MLSYTGISIHYVEEKEEEEKNTPFRNRAKFSHEIIPFQM